MTDREFRCEECGDRCTRLLDGQSEAGLNVTGGDRYFEDAYFDPDDREHRSLKLVDCWLPEIESDYAAEAMIKRVRSSGEQFTREIGSAAMQVAEDAQGVASDALEQWRTRYDAGIDRDDLTERQRQEIAETLSMRAVSFDVETTVTMETG